MNGSTVIMTCDVDPGQVSRIKMGNENPLVPFLRHGFIICRHALECHASRAKFHMSGEGNVKVESQCVP